LRYCTALCCILSRYHQYQTTALSLSLSSASFIMNHIFRIFSELPPSPAGSTVNPANIESVFTQWQHIDALLMSGIMVLLIVFTICFDLFLGLIEKRLLQHQHYMRILHQVYKELMILGFVSFTLLIVRSSVHLSETVVLTLEFVHTWIFFW
jgi:hypothetical protein